MMYQFAQDLKSIREISDMSQEEFASCLGVERVTISRNELGKTEPSEKFMEQVYTFAFQKKIRLNRLKEMLWRENLERDHKLLFHGAKDALEGEPSVHVGRANNDFGQGFYTGENYEQAISFVSGFQKSSVYLLDLNGQGLKCRQYEVDQNWMLTIAYYRGTLSGYQSHPLIEKLRMQSRDCDYIIAPIADNRMFQIINSFIEGEITDEQCKHCLSATNLGFQYVFISDKAITHLKLLERCYLSENEKTYYKSKRSDEAKLGDDKVKLARIQYRGKGKYIDEILK